MTGLSPTFRIPLEIRNAPNAVPPILPSIPLTSLPWLSVVKNVPISNILPAVPDQPDIPGKWDSLDTSPIKSNPYPPSLAQSLWNGVFPLLVSLCRSFLSDSRVSYMFFLLLHLVGRLYFVPRGWMIFDLSLYIPVRLLSSSVMYILFLHSRHHVVLFASRDVQRLRSCWCILSAVWWVHQDFSFLWIVLVWVVCSGLLAFFCQSVPLCPHLCPV